MFRLALSATTLAALLLSPDRVMPSTRLSQAPDPIGAALANEHRVVESYVLKSADETPPSSTPVSG